MTRRIRSPAEIRWTNPSVRKLAAEGSPVESILRRVRCQAFAAMESGWSGPPYDPLKLAELSGVEVIPIEEVEDARLVHRKGHPRIEFNPNRNPERVRFSIAHELGHLAFPDAAEEVRYRAHSVNAETDAWQVELLCNLAAAELLMPTGSFPQLADDITLEHLIDLASEFFVSVEAAVLRAVRLAAQPACAFAAARVDEDRFRLDYIGGSRFWEPTLDVTSITESEALMRCSAVGSTAKEEIGVGKESLQLECLGTPPYPHTRYPRVVGVIRRLAHQAEGPVITYLNGDATDPQGPGEKLIAHIVNDKAAIWGGHGFAPQLRTRYPGLQESFCGWAASSEGLVLGRIHLHQAEPWIWVCTMVAQHNYGLRAAKIPLRYAALEECLRRLRAHLETNPATIHMPRIGAGQAGGDWSVISEMIARQLLDIAPAVNVYLPAGAEVPRTAHQQLGLHI